MTLLAETLAISLCMILLSALALFSKTVERHSKVCFLLGTGALVGILFFDLLPELFNLAGPKSLLGVGLVGLGYSLLHFSPLGHHGSLGCRHNPRHIYVFFASMVGHCLASGVLLVASLGLGASIKRTVFLALLCHKVYEVLTVSSLLVEGQRSRAQGIALVSIYSLSLPVGVGLTFMFRSILTPEVAMWATSLAAGTLLGCLIFDFLIPSLTHLRARRLDVAWIAAGLVFTQLVMERFS